MKHASLLLIGLVLPLAAGCPQGPMGTSDDDGVTGDLVAFHEDWQPVVEGIAFPIDPEEEGAITSITIGRKEFAGNFANRGDVEVLFDQTSSTISIEMRRYAIATEDEIDDQIDRLSLWAYAASTPAKPDDMDPTLNCQDVWQSGCQVLLYYDGQLQPARTGADFRVHLPVDYREDLLVRTEDNTEEDGYRLRGDVTIVDACGSVDVEMSSGIANVRMCRDLTPGPTCSDAEIQACETFEVDGEPAPWDTSCPCDTFGQLNVEATAPWAANITVDIPDDVWTSIQLDNRAAGQTPTEGNFCPATFADCGGNCTLNQSSETPWKAQAEFNNPGPSAPAGAGYAMNIVSNGCESVPYVNEPSDFDDDPAKPSEIRGDLTVCTGCL